MRIGSCLVLGLLLALSPRLAVACNLPVFRFALLHWPPASFTALIVQRGALTPDLQGAATLLESRYLDVACVDRDDMRTPVAPALAALSATIPDDALPRLVLLRTANSGVFERVWDGPFTPASATLLVAASDRAEVSRRLLAGDSAVWMVLQGRDAAAGQAALDLVDRAARRAEAELRLPVVDETAGIEAMLVASPVPLRLRFSVLAVAGDAPGGELLRAMLAPMLPPGVTSADTLAVPLFGRGRALCVLGGQTLTESGVLEACRTLVGTCACEAKARNPGLDLFLPVNWNAAVFGDAAVSRGLPLAVPAARPPTAKTLSACTGQQKQRASRSLSQRLLAAAGVALAAAGVATWLLLRKGRR